MSFIYHYNTFLSEFSRNKDVDPSLVRLLELFIRYVENTRYVELQVFQIDKQTNILHPKRGDYISTSSDIFDSFIKILEEKNVEIEIQDVVDEDDHYQVYIFNTPILFRVEPKISRTSIFDYLYNIYLDPTSRSAKVCPLDLELICQNNEIIKVHKVVIAALDHQLFNLVFEDGRANIKMTEFDITTVKIFVDYVYLDNSLFISKYKNVKIDYERCFDFADYYRLQPFFNILITITIDNKLYDQINLAYALQTYEETQKDNLSFVGIVCAKHCYDPRVQLRDILIDNQSFIKYKYIAMYYTKNGMGYLFKYNDQCIEFFVGIVKKKATIFSEHKVDYSKFFKLQDNIELDSKLIDVIMKCENNRVKNICEIYYEKEQKIREKKEAELKYRESLLLS